MPALTSDLWAAVCKEDPQLAQWLRLQTDANWFKFTPRPDDPANFDEQYSFVNNRDLVSFMVGGNGCVAGETLIYDPVLGTSRRIDTIDAPFHVVSRNPSTGEFETAIASRPFVKGVESLYRVSLSNGDSFTVTNGHRVADCDGIFHRVGQLRVGHRLLSSSCLKHSVWNCACPCITSIEFVRQDSYYDITVLPHHNYVLGSTVHHNSGKTECAAHKCAKFLLSQQAPPRQDTPFWILAETYDQVCGTCWLEKLWGNGHIPESEIQWDRVRWYSASDRWPFSVPLKPWPKERGGHPDKNWKLEFKSYGQGRQAMQARSIGGFWFSEQFDLSIFIEVLRGCRDYMFRGGQFTEFTPIDPTLCVWVEKAMEKTPKGWRFYRSNTQLNKAVSSDWFEQFIAIIPEELLQTRLTGALASFEGSIYKSFSPAIHVVDSIDWPRGIHHWLGIDWGASEAHPFACVWGYRDGVGNWVVYDEYLSTSQSMITEDHADEIYNRCRAWGWPEFRAEQVSDYHHVAYADPSRPGEIMEFCKRGIPTQSASNEVYGGINYVRSLFKCSPITGEPRMVIHSRCKHLIEQLRKYRWAKDHATAKTLNSSNIPQPKPIKREDDLPDALRYMVYSSRNSDGMIPESTTKHVGREWHKSLGIQNDPKLKHGVRSA